MSKKSPLQAFVSSTYLDLMGHRQCAIDTLRRSGIHVDPMEDWSADDREPQQFCRERVDGCDLCILLVAFRRGHVPTGQTLSITQLEYQRALERRVTVLPFLLADEEPWPRRFDELDRDPGIRAWREQLRHSHGVGTFGLQPYSLDVGPPLTRWLQEKVGTAEAGLPHAASDRNLLFGILALQMDFISRDALVEAMHSWVRDKGKPIGQILLSQGTLAPDEVGLLEALIGKHLGRHENDPQKSLAVLSPDDVVRQSLSSLPDPELHASLACITPSRLPQGDAPHATRHHSVPPPSSIGGRFRVLRPLARGGLGQISVAFDEELRREVALKEIRLDHADDPESRARFLREAEVTGRLEHPGIVPVYSLRASSDGRPYYAMRLIQGESLQEAIERFHRGDVPGQDVEERSLQFRHLLRRFIAACNAVAYAHSRGVLHRDLKPSNIMLGPFGETLVVDWGLARLLPQEQETSASVDTPAPSTGDELKHTRVGSILGTLQYMSPEQAAGRTDLVGTASDVYSLGATLYCLLTGRPPCPDADPSVVLKRVQEGEFSAPRKIKSWVSPPLEAVCLEALALRPEDRYPSVDRLVDDLNRLLDGKPISAQPALAARVRFEQCFTPELAEQLVSRPELLSGREAEITVLFAGVQGFSRFSERAGPAQTFQFVQDVAEVLSGSVYAHDGIVVDCIGDEVMSMWGAPIPQPDHASRACRAALAMLAGADELSRRWEGTVGERVQLAIGIHTGPAPVGSTGSHRSFKYGPLGNVVALASRLKGATGYLRTNVLVTDATQAQLGSEFAVRRLCDVRVANIPTPLRLHELVLPGLADWQALRSRYEQALGLFEQGEFRAASLSLGEILAAFPHDGPSLVLMARAATAMVGGPIHPGMDRADSEDRIWELPSK